MDQGIYDSIDKRFVTYYEWVEKNKSKLLTASELEKYRYDWPRFAISLGLMDKYYGDKEFNVLELGGEGVSTKFLRAKFPKWKIQSYSKDLRQKGWDLEDKSFDLIVNMEVVEHLTDIYEEDYEWNASFTYSGLINCLRESKRILKNTGRMLLTTPNVCSYINLYKMIVGDIPHQYPPHVREYSYGELVAIIERVKMSVVNYECIETMCVCWDFSYISDFIKQSNESLEHRNSTFFFDLGVGGGSN